MATTGNNADDFNLGGIPIGDFLGASLVSIAKAQSMMSKEQAKGLIETCFSKKGNAYEPVMLKMVLSRSYLVPASGTEPAKLERLQTNFDLPIITLLPINVLGVDNVNLKFSIEITSQYTKNTQSQVSTETESGRDATPSDKPPKKKRSEVLLLGKISSSASSNEEEKTGLNRKNTTSIQVNMEAKPLPLSKGLLTLIDFYTKAIQPTDDFLPSDNS